MHVHPSRPLLALSLAVWPLLAGCASSGRAAAGPPDVVQTQRPMETSPSGLTGTGASVRSVTEDFVRTAALPATPEQVWAVLPAVYDELKLSANTMVAAERRIGSQGVRFRDRVGGERAARSLSCGTAADGREAADSYELTLDIVTMVVPAEDGSAVRTILSGLARPVFTSGEPVRCASTGRLEERIAATVRAKLAR